MRQLIIARKDLQMSPGKLAAQVSHASMAFLTNMVRHGDMGKRMSVELYKNGVSVPVIATAASVSVDIINKWLGIQPA